MLKTVFLVELVLRDGIASNCELLSICKLKSKVLKKQNYLIEAQKGGQDECPS
jgi:hypothetical protein